MTAVEELLPYGGVALLLAVLLWALNSFAGGIVEDLGRRSLDSAVRRKAAREFLSRRQLRGYAKALRTAHAAHSAAFRPDDTPADVQDTYIPRAMVVTCRDEVYHGELSPHFQRIVKIGELDDTALRLLLRRRLGAQEEVERLFAGLQAGPPLLAMARSPLLLGRRRDAAGRGTRRGLGARPRPGDGGPHAAPAGRPRHRPARGRERPARPGGRLPAGRHPRLRAGRVRQGPPRRRGRAEVLPHGRLPRRAHALPG